MASSGSSTSAYQFGASSGYRTEGDAGLTLVGCRFYDAQVGRFITRDTYLDQAPYAYCDGDPVNATDPTGHSVWGKIGAGFLGYIGVCLVVYGILICLMVADFPLNIIVGGIVGVAGLLLFNVAMKGWKTW